MTFTASADGLNLDYTIVDKEVAFSAPAPATDWRFTHTESTGEHAAISYGDFSIMMRGDRNVDKKNMIRIAANIMQHKLLGAAILKNVFRVLSYSMTDISGADQTNEIRVACRVRHIRSPISENLEIQAILSNLLLSMDDKIYKPIDLHQHLLLSGQKPKVDLHKSKQEENHQRQGYHYKFPEPLPLIQ